jgi:protein-S-isoprenylcysteine O-methyltransferase Ste14
MYMTVTKSEPTLQKTRIKHSRILVAAVMLALLFVRPAGSPDALVALLRDGAGVALVMFGVFGRVYCSLFIGGRKNTLVVRQGPYSVVRNPLYVFSFLAMLGVCLLSGMLALLVVMVAAFVFYYPNVVRREEAFLMAKYGEAYAAYVREVPRWLPCLSLWQQPELVEVKPEFVFKTMRDASVFLCVPLYFYVVELLQAQQVVPVWLMLP